MGPFCGSFCLGLFLRPLPSCVMGINSKRVSQPHMCTPFQSSVGSAPQKGLCVLTSTAEVEGRTPPTQTVSSSLPCLPFLFWAQFSLHCWACVLVMAMCSRRSRGEETADS